MRRILLTALIVTAMLAGSAGVAHAVEFCLGIVGSPGSNIWRLEATQFGNFVALNGRERRFEERAVVGTAYVEPPANTSARLGFTTYVNSGSGQAVVDLQLSLITLSGPFRLVNVGGGISTGDMAVVACTATTSAAGSPTGLRDLLRE